MFTIINDKTQVSPKTISWLNGLIYDCWLEDFSITFTKSYFLSLGIILSRSIIYNEYKAIEECTRLFCEYK